VANRYKSHCIFITSTPPQNSHVRAENTWCRALRSVPTDVKRHNGETPWRPRGRWHRTPSAQWILESSRSSYDIRRFIRRYESAHMKFRATGKRVAIPAAAARVHRTVRSGASPGSGPAVAGSSLNPGARSSGWAPCSTRPTRNQRLTRSGRAGQDPPGRAGPEGPWVVSVDVRGSGRGVGSRRCGRSAAGRRSTRHESRNRERPELFVAPLRKTA
jgi:hypothetical protein